MGKRDKGRRRSKRFIRLLGGGEDLLRMWKRGMEKKLYFVCDFNERWLKDSSFIYCFDVLLSVEGRVVSMIKVGYFF
jgi:hypothetical protein